MKSHQTRIPVAMTLEEARDALLALVAQQHLNHFRIGVIYNHVVDARLAEKHAKKSAQEYFSEHVRTLSQSVLTTCGAVARAFTEDACARYGVYNLKALLTYTRISGIRPSPHEPGPIPIVVPREDGTEEQKPFSECSVEELKRAAKHRREPLNTWPSTEERTRIQTLRDRVSRNFAGASSRTRVNSRLYLGTAYVTLQDVPVAELERLLQALKEGLGSDRVPSQAARLRPRRPPSHRCRRNAGLSSRPSKIRPSAEGVPGVKQQDPPGMLHLPRHGPPPRAASALEHGLRRLEHVLLRGGVAELELVGHLEPALRRGPLLDGGEPALQLGQPSTDTPAQLWPRTHAQVAMSAML
jgi:hypothetical protein